MGVRSRRKSNQKMESCVSTLPFVGDAGGQNVVECGDAVGGDDEQPVFVHAVDVAHFAAGMAFDAGEIGFEE